MSNLPFGIPRKIALEHLDTLEDIESFSQVCSLWRSETRDIDYTNFCPSKNTQLPLLMLADSPTTSYRRFYNLSTRKFIKIDIPRFEEHHDDDHRRFFFSKGWVVTVTMKQALITFFDPFTATLIKPPSIPILSFVDGGLWDDDYYSYQFSKFIFSDGAWPSSSSSDFQVAMIYDLYKYIAFWRPGQQQWIKPNMDIDVRQVEDVCFFKGEFYSIDIYSRVIAFGSEMPKRPPRIIADLKSQGLAHEVPYQYYIVAFNQNESTLLIVHKDVSEEPDMYNTNNNNPNRDWTKSFQLIELNVDDGKAKLIHNLGNRALFVGYNSTFFVKSPSDQRKRGGRPNSIYFTDDNYEAYHNRGGGKDMGIFCLKEGKRIEPLYEGPSQYSDVTPPTWVELPHY